jgi:Tol biopolymer transport system component
MTTRPRGLRLVIIAVLAVTVAVPARRRSVTMARPAVVRLMLAVPLTLAVLFSAPTQRVVAGMNSTRAGSTSSLGADAPLHRMANGKIAFLGGFADGSLAVINPDGSRLRRLARCTARGCGICGAVWSPDGRRIAFVGDRATNRSIDHYPLINMSVYVMNANGSGERRVASWGQGYITCWGESLAWSPDGASLAIARGGSLYVPDLKTGGMRRLTAPTSGADLDPAWSPDGSSIAFARAPGCGSICPLLTYIVNADGRGMRQLSAFYGELFCGGPIWSPDRGRARQGYAAPCQRPECS